MYKSSPEPYSRPGSGMSTTGRIPAIATMDSGSIKIPENNIIEFHNEKAREQWAITKQVLIKILSKNFKYFLVNFVNFRRTEALL